MNYNIFANRIIATNDIVKSEMDVQTVLVMLFVSVLKYATLKATALLRYGLLYLFYYFHNNC